ncbi:MAG: lipopolysaccharide biosynthesis protein [Actinomycetota bacterium]|nr:lipopolysaccharide biosynthesis protein [Actinomycetota bacterium]
MDSEPPIAEAEDYGQGSSLARKAIRGASLATVGWIASQTLTFLAYVVLARLLTPRDFGDYAAGAVLVSWGFLFTEGGMMSALIRRRDRGEEAASTAFFALLVSGTLLTVMALAVSPLFGVFFNSDRVATIAAALSPWLFVNALAIVPDALLQRRLSFARRVAVDPLAAVTFATVSIVACALGAGVWGLVAGSYAQEIVTVVTSWRFARFRPRFSLASFALWRELAAFARPVLGSEILRRIASQLSTVLLGKFAGTPTLGQFRNGFRLALQPHNAFVNVGGYVLLPTLARISDDKSRLRAATQRVLGLATIVAVPVSFALIPLGVPIAVLALGPIWRPAGHAIAALWGLLLGGVIISVTAELSKATGRPDRLIRVQSFSLVATVALISAGVPFGLVGVASAVSVSQCATALYSYAVIAPLVGLRWKELGRQFLGPALATAVMLAAMFAFTGLTDPVDHPEATAIALVLGEVAMGTVIYAGALLALDRGRRSQLRGWLRIRRARASSAAA